MTTASRSMGARIWPGLALVIAGAVFGDGAALTTAYRGSSPVSDERLSYPWDGATAVTTSVVWGAAQILFTIGLIALARSSAITSKRGRRGAQAAVVGSSLYTVAHVVSVVARDARMDDAIGVVVLSCFGVGTVLVALGLLVAGIDVVRSLRWSGWRRYAPVALGSWMLVMLPLQFTAALPAAIGLYAAATVALGVALLVETITAEAPPPHQVSVRS